MVSSTNEATHCNNNNNNNQHHHHTDVIFLGNNSKSYQFNTINGNQKRENEENNIYEQNNSNLNDVSHMSNKLNSCKTLQRKLEMKVERAKRNYSHFNNNQPKVNVGGKIQSLYAVSF